MTTHHDVHVVSDPDGGRWTVRRNGRTLSNHRTQAAALSAARRVAERHQIDLVMHGRDGKIRSKDSYGNERAIRDTEP